MDKKIKIISLITLISSFVIIDLTIFGLFTSLVLPSGSAVMRAKSIELGEYLPFEKNSKIIKKNDNLSLTGEKPIIDSAAALYPISSSFVNAIYNKEDVKFINDNFTSSSKLQMNNTRNCYKGIVDGNIDIGLLAKPSSQQLEYASKNNVELILEPIGYESFVFLVNKNNPIDSLTIEQVKGIYSGKYTNWSELGGYNKEIIPLQRNEGSGSQTAFLSLMNGEKTITKPINRFGSAIGFSFRYYVEDVVKNGNVKMISLNDVYPNKENIQNKSYPIVSSFYAVYSSKNTNPNVKKVVDWMKLDIAQEIINEVGYVGL